MQSKYAVEAFKRYALRFGVKGFGIDVVLIEPGFIRSSFSDATIDRIKLSNRNDPYAAFDRAVAAATRRLSHQILSQSLAAKPMMSRQ